MLILLASGAALAVAGVAKVVQAVPAGPLRPLLVDMPLILCGGAILILDIAITVGFALVPGGLRSYRVAEEDHRRDHPEEYRD
jgi:hypothetical protein